MRSVGTGWLGLVGVVMTWAWAVEPEPRWQKMPIRTPEQFAAGIEPGGEGAQWPRGPVAVSPADPDFLLLPIDVGGVYRSRDGGANWSIAMSGWNPRGANGFAIDPRNASRAVGIGANSMNWGANWGRSPHGLYLTVDKAASWRQVLTRLEGFDGLLAYDPTSFDAGLGYCRVVYYLAAGGELIVSHDGGESWATCDGAPNPGALAGGDWSTSLKSMPGLGVDPRRGDIWLAGQHGLYQSSDRGATWTQVRTSPVTWLHCAADGRLFAVAGDRISVTADAGKSWTELPAVGLKVEAGQRLQGLVVSPADPRRMLCYSTGRNWQWPRWVSWDGGATFQEVKTERDGAALPLNARQGYFTWHPTDPAIAWCIGGDWVVKSTDGGRTFHWSNNGYNGVMTGGSFAFSVHDPDLVLLAFQDYNGAFTTDGGRTWNYRDISGHGWGGHEYSGFALNRQVMWTGDAEGWGSPRRLRLTRDGGETWQFVPGPDGQPLLLGEQTASHGDPSDPAIGFAGSLRTADAGRSWSRMAGCQAVYTWDCATLALYGADGRRVVTSNDHGQTWRPVAEAPVAIADVAVDSQRGLLWVAGGDRLHRWQDGQWQVVDTPVDQYGNRRIKTVAVDPAAPNVVYIAGSRDIYATSATVCRSTDAGQTWRNLTVNEALLDGQEGGPHEVGFVRVHPRTRELWAAGQCFGMWRLAAPGD